MINNNQPHNWKADTRASVDFYNDWFMRFAPQAFRESRIDATKMVEQSFKDTDFLHDITAISLKANPTMLPVLRMSTCPPIAVDRLVGLADVPKGIVDTIEKKGKLAPGTTANHLDQIIGVIDRLLDRDIFLWLSAGTVPGPVDAHRAATIVADRYCGAFIDQSNHSECPGRTATQLRRELAACAGLH